MPGTWFLVLAYLTGGAVLFAAARRKRLNTEGMGWLATAALIGGALGARAAEWLLGQGIRPEGVAGFLDPRYGGRTVIGGVIGGWLAVEIAKKLLGMTRSTGDLFALGLPAGEAVGRIGCFFNGCCYGTACHLPWAVYQHGAWRHPAQLYASAAAAAQLALLFALRDRFPTEGALFRLYLVLFGASRFFVEFARERTIWIGGLSLAQWVCLEMAVAGALLLCVMPGVRRTANAEGC